MNNSNQESLYNYLTCYTFATFILLLALLCIGILIVSKQMKHESHISPIYDALKEKLEIMRVYCEDYHIRMLAEQSYKYGYDLIEDLLTRGNYLYWWLIPDEFIEQYEDCNVMIMSRYLYIKLMARLKLNSDPVRLKELQDFQIELAKVLKGYHNRFSEGQVMDIEAAENIMVKEKVQYDHFRQKMDSIMVDFKEELQRKDRNDEKYRQFEKNDMKKVDPMWFHDTISAAGIKNQVMVQEFVENPQSLLKGIFDIFAENHKGNKAIGQDEFGRLRNYVGINESLPLSSLEALDKILSNCEYIEYAGFESLIQKTADIIYPDVDQAIAMNRLLKEKIYKTMIRERKIKQDQINNAENQENNENWLEYGNEEKTIKEQRGWFETLVLLWAMLVHKLCRMIGGVAQELSNIDECGIKVKTPENTHNVQTRVEPYSWTEITTEIVSTLLRFAKNKSERTHAIEFRGDSNLSKCTIYIICLLFVLEFYYFILPCFRPELGWGLPDFVNTILFTICFEFNNVFFR